METRSSPSMRELRALAADRGLKYFLHLSKPELFSLLQRKEGGGCAKAGASAAPAAVSASAPPAAPPAMTAGDRQDAEVRPTRSSERLSSRKKNKREAEDDGDRKAKKRKPKQIANTLDPIMLEDLGPHTFEFERPNGSVVLYNVDTLVQYILATGDFSEPQTRIPFSDDDLRRIDAEAAKAGLKEQSVWDAKQDKHKFDEQKVKRDGILGLERCAGEYVTKMLEVIEDDDPEEGEMLLIMTIFPSFSDIFHQIRHADKEYATQCMNHFKAYVKGPKNRPSEDNCGLLDVILGFLDDVDKGNQDASAFGF